MKGKLRAHWFSIPLLAAAVLLSGCQLAGYRTPAEDEPHAELRIETRDRVRILLLDEKGCMTRSQELADGPSLLGTVPSRADSSAVHFLRADQEAIMEYASASVGKFCRILFAFQPENGARYRLSGNRFIDPKGDTFFGKEVSAEKCGVFMTKENADGSQIPVPLQGRSADLVSPLCTRFITPEEVRRKYPPAVPRF